jgi:hypothetical protein
MMVSKARNGRFLLSVTLLLLASSFLLLSCSSEVSIEPGVQPTVPVFTGGPRLHFEQVFIELGEATPNQPLSTEFRFRNIGDAPLELYSTDKESLEGC